MKKERIGRKIIVAAMAVAMAFTISEGTKMVTSPAHADQEDADSFDPLYYAALYPDVAAAVGQLGINLIRKHEDIGSAQYLRDLLQMVPPHDRAGRIVGERQDQQFGFWG